MLLDDISKKWVNFEIDHLNTIIPYHMGKVDVGNRKKTGPIKDSPSIFTALNKMKEIFKAGSMIIKPSTKSVNISSSKNRSNKNKIIDLMKNEEKY